MTEPHNAIHFIDVFGHNFLEFVGVVDIHNIGNLVCYRVGRDEMRCISIAERVREMLDAFSFKNLIIVLLSRWTETPRLFVTSESLSGYGKLVKLSRAPSQTG